MIIFFHENNKVNQIISLPDNKELSIPDLSISITMFYLANLFPDHFILWCESKLKDFINYEQLDAIFHHKLIFATYNKYENKIFSNAIGYVSESIFSRIVPDIKYPTWIMSGSVGGIHSQVLNCLKKYTEPDSNFDFFLTSIAKISMPVGLLCTSEPSLLFENEIVIKNNKPSIYRLTKFVKQHFKTRWLFFLFLGKFLNEKKLIFFPIIVSLYYKKKHINEFIFENISVKSSLKNVSKKEIDVVIPTIGRKKYLYDVLKDLAMQTHLPKNVIIVEQNPHDNSLSELLYLQNETWPFKIDHTFIHQTGACNARNLALEKVTSDWVFLADDDIRLESTFIEKSFLEIYKYQNESFSFKCYIKDDLIKIKNNTQWSTFGSGCSIVKTSRLKNTRFNLNYEFGYGEDADFGMQLRNAGVDVIYLPKPSILHLKAPVGGFRSKFSPSWINDKIQPKPSPTVMLFKLLYNSYEQIYGYKLVLLFKYYTNQNIINPFTYLKTFKKQWNKSVNLAYILKDKT